MRRLARFYNEHIIDEKFPDVPEVAWGQKLKKLFEIEESFYKQAQEAFARQERENFEIYSGLAAEALDQIRNSVEKADTPVAASIENNSEPTQEQTPSLNLLVRVCRFYLDYEVFIVLSVVSLFLGTQAPIEVGSGYPVVDGLVSALLYGFGLTLICGFCKNAISVAIESGLLLNWRKYLRVIVALGAIVYGFAFLEAKANPWTLWKRSWSEFESGVEMKKLGLYTTQKTCVDDQWKLLKEELSNRKSTQEILKKFPLKHDTAYIVEGRTIFEFGKSLYSRSPELRDKFAADTSKRTELSDYQKRQLIAEVLRPEIVSTISFFCASTSKNALWPFHTPNYYAPGEALRDLGERTLAGRAEKILGD